MDLVGDPGVRRTADAASHAVIRWSNMRLAEAAGEDDLAAAEADMLIKLRNFVNAARRELGVKAIPMAD